MTNPTSNATPLSFDDAVRTIAAGVQQQQLLDALTAAAHHNARAQLFESQLYAAKQEIELLKSKVAEGKPKAKTKTDDAHDDLVKKAADQAAASLNGAKPHG